MVKEKKINYFSWLLILGFLVLLLIVTVKFSYDLYSDRIAIDNEEGSFLQVLFSPISQTSSGFFGKFFSLFNPGSKISQTTNNYARAANTPSSSKSNSPTSTPTTNPSQPNPDADDKQRYTTEKCGSGECKSGEYCCKKSICCNNEDECGEEKGKAYCNPNKCTDPTKPKLCKSKNFNWCCPKDSECITASYWWGTIVVSDCGRNKCRDDEFICPQKDPDFFDKINGDRMYKCCKNNFEKCETEKTQSNYPTCMALDVPRKGFVYCKGTGDYGYSSIWCPEDQICSNHPNGAPRCIVNEPIASGSSGDTTGDGNLASGGSAGSGSGVEIEVVSVIINGVPIIGGSKGNECNDFEDCTIDRGGRFARSCTFGCFNGYCIHVKDEDRVWCLYEHPGGGSVSGICINGVCESS